MYLPYEPISNKQDFSAYVPLELLEAQKQGKSLIPNKISKNWDKWVSEKLGITIEKMFFLFSSEQIDSIGLTILNFEKGKGFIIGDETGIGKGRILSGICRWAIANNKKILFFTEREHLFSDFWRDLVDTELVDLLVDPVVFHSKAKVYDPNGGIVLKGTTKSVKTIQEKGFTNSTNLVMTNYSQISLKEHFNTKKDILSKYVKDNLIIMDESHNATGDSNTKKFLLEVLEETSNIVFSSATFIKDESQLDIYEKVIDFDAPTLKLLKKLLSNDSELLLRKIFTYELTRKLQFWRREHQPLSVGWKVINCDDEENQKNYINRYSEIINGLFQLVNTLSKEPAISSMEITNSWFSLGATINRLSRNLLLLFKIDGLIDGIKKSLSNNHKCVIVIDSTFASIINKVISNQTTTEDNDDEVDNVLLDTELKTDYELNFKQVIYYILEEVVGKIIKENSFNVSESLKAEYEILKEKAVIFESLNISPIDMIINGLKKENIQANEISGRTFKINEFGKIEKIVKQPKSKLVAEFNSGEKDVIIITRAGASGISLHSSATFIDKRVRDLFELEITSRPTYRLQFIGRVNRKNQVSQPEFYTVVTKLPFEQRILNVEQQKLKRLQSHISGDDEKLEQENIYNFYTKYCDQCAYWFLKNHPTLAFQMGISLKTKKDDLYYIDSILKRCIVLTSEQQNFLYDYLIYCTECEKKLSIRKSLPSSIKFESIKTFWHELDQIQQKEFKDAFGTLPQNSINQFRYPWVGLMKTISTYDTKSVFSKNLKDNLEQNQLKNIDIKKHLQNTLLHYKGRADLNQHVINNYVAPLINQIEIGRSISIKNIEGAIFGYIHDITYPTLVNSHIYDSICLIHIKTMNPNLHESIYYAPTDYYVTLKEIFELDDVKIYANSIDWKKYDRPQNSYLRTNYSWVGHPVYMEFLRQSYRIGEVRYFDVGTRKNMCVILPNDMKEENIHKLKKPIFNANQIMGLLINKKVNRLVTTWEDEKIMKPTLKLEPTSGGYNLFVAKEISRDPEFMDFPLKKKLKNLKGTVEGYEVFMIPYKEVRGILGALENRDVIWFID